MNSEQGIAQNYATRIVQIDERRGPLLVHLNQNQWSMVKDVFREAASRGNPPAGWNIDRVYINNRSDYYLPALLKDSIATKSMFYCVSKTGYCIPVLCLSNSYSKIPEKEDTTLL